MENSKVCACILLAAEKSREGRWTRGGGCCPVVAHIQEVLGSSSSTSWVGRKGRSSDRQWGPSRQIQGSFSSYQRLGQGSWEHYWDERTCFSIRVSGWLPQDILEGQNLNFDESRKLLWLIFSINLLKFITVCIGCRWGRHEFDHSRKI